ncbi:SPRY domain-containing SOCS box protein 3 isoform X2 [Culicoides brevitarsis]|uniref:SPRY domain-containing SOCS box protein 3 isoform X2 n=1 Tax=Culicoides brevitarsis TaxID=469753 RepID=UPI00307C4B23
MPEQISKIFGGEITKDLISDTATPFCKCSKRMLDRRLSTNDVIKSSCTCGEEHNEKIWNWDVTKERSDVLLQNDNVLTFHPIYSQGTAVVKGDAPLELGKQHYWEVKIMSFLTGTDFMIGVGTDKVNIDSHHYQFTSFLGNDDQSWGFSYRGLIQHNHRVKYYGQKYSRGVIVGVHLDLEGPMGIIEFYLNRRPQGKAYLNIPIDQNTKIYPMACSTSAKTSIKLINSTSVKKNLQYHCMETIAKNPEMLELVKSIPGFKRLSHELWFLQCKQRYQYHSDFEKNNLMLEDEAILSSKKKKFIEETDNDDDSSLDSLEDLYKNAHRIKHFKRAINTTTAERSKSDTSDDSEIDETPLIFFCNHY